MHSMESGESQWEEEDKNRKLLIVNLPSTVHFDPTVAANKAQ